MNTYSLMVGDAVMYTGGTALVLILIILTTWLLMVTIAWCLKSWIDTHEGWDAFTSFREWYNSEDGRVARAQRAATFTKYARIKSWIGE